MCVYRDLFTIYTIWATTEKKNDCTYIDIDLNTQRQLEFDSFQQLTW